MQKRTELYWLMIIICVISTTIIFLTKSSQVYLSSTQTNLFMKHFELKNHDCCKNGSKNELLVQLQDLIKHRMENRVNTVKNVCENIKPKPPALQVITSKIIVAKKYGISWCPIYKASSSLWMKNFAILGGVLTNTTMQLIHENLLQMNTIVNQVFPRNTNYEKAIKDIGETKKFLIVRHPFERLLSAYRDKLEHVEGREYYYNRFGRHIIHKYRPNKDMNYATSLTPTFSEFLLFIVNEKYYDEHWIPYYDSCEPCFIDYNYIIKFEKLQEEQLFLLKETGLLEYVNLYNDFRNVNPYGATTNVIAEKYFKNVERTLLETVYEIYKIDFLMFSYVPDEYYFIAREENNNTNSEIEIQIK